MGKLGQARWRFDFHWARALVLALPTLWRGTAFITQTTHPKRGGDGVNHEYRIKRIRNIIKRYEESEQLMGDFVAAWELIKEQVEVTA
jgi:hypothetical protein